MSNAFAAILQTKLKKRQPVPELGGEIFYHKSLNSHRCVLVADISKRPDVSPPVIREIVGRYHRASWFRGMGFGVVLAVDSVARVASAFDAEIDVRNRRAGVWQWSLLYSSAERCCMGYHTWTHGMTTPLFQAILRQFHAQRYRINDRKAQMGRLMSAVTTWTPHGRLIKQYEEIFPA